MAVAAHLVERAETISPATIAVMAAAIGYHTRIYSLPKPASDDGFKVIPACLARQGQTGAQKQARRISLQYLAAIPASAMRTWIGRSGRMESAMHARDLGILDMAL